MIRDHGNGKVTIQFLPDMTDAEFERVYELLVQSGGKGVCIDVDGRPVAHAGQCTTLSADQRLSLGNFMAWIHSGCPVDNLGAPFKPRQVKSETLGDLQEPFTVGDYAFHMASREIYAVLDRLQQDLEQVPGGIADLLLVAQTQPRLKNRKAWRKAVFAAGPINSYLDKLLVSKSGAKKFAKSLVEGM